MSVDLKGGLKIPIGVTTTNLKPAIIVESEKTKQMGIIELKVPIEDRIEVSGEIKKEKYQRIVNEGKQNGWRVTCWAVEIGRISSSILVKLFEKSWIFRKRKEECN